MPAPQSSSRSRVRKALGVMIQVRRLARVKTISATLTQAAAEYVSKPEHIKELISHLNTSPDPSTPKLPPYYQIVIKVKVNGGVPVQISYVTHHVL